MTPLFCIHVFFICGKTYFSNFCFQFNDNVKKVMVDALNKEYVSDRLNSTNVVSNAWNYIFMTVFTVCLFVWFWVVV